MTLREFFKQLPRDGWELQGQLIRRGDWPWCMCPVSSLLNEATCMAGEVAFELGMSLEFTCRIARAADEPSTPTEHRIRRLLLAHCGLTEPSVAAT
jgi:hypothetical protein